MLICVDFFEIVCYNQTYKIHIKESRIMEWLFVGIAILLAVSAVCFIFIYKRKNNSELTVETIAGEKCTVVEVIDNYAGSGLVKVKNQIWAARAVVDDDIFESGEVLSVVAIEGARLVCKK